MRFVVAAIVTGVLLSAAAFANDGRLRFSGEVAIEGATSMAFAFPLSKSEVRFVDLPNGHRLEVSVSPLAVDSASRAQARLLRQQGEVYVVLHEATMKGPPNADHSFAYAVCKEGVRFMSPAPSKTPSC